MKGVLLAGGSVALVGVTVRTAADASASILALALALLAGALATRVPLPSVNEHREWTIAPGVVLAVGISGLLPWPAVCAVVAGIFTAEAISWLRRGAVGTSALAACTVFFGLAAAEPLAAVPLADAPRLDWQELSVIAIIGMAWFSIEAVLHAASAPTWRQARRFHILRALADWHLGLVPVSAAVTFAVLWPHSVGWAFAVSLVPLGVALHLGRRVAAGKARAELTVRALGRLPEAAGLNHSGHSQGVADLAVAMGKLEGWVGPALAELETAAQLHDIGLLATTSGTVRASGFSAGEVAMWGADIMRASTALGPAAEIVARSRDPFRVPGLDPDPGLDRRSQIVQAACKVVERLEEGVSIDTAVEELYEQSLYQLDPHVVSLIRPAALISDTVLDELMWRQA